MKDPPTSSMRVSGVPRYCRLRALYAMAEMVISRRSLSFVSFCIEASKLFHDSARRVLRLTPIYGLCAMLDTNCVLRSQCNAPAVVGAQVAQFIYPAPLPHIEPSS